MTILLKQLELTVSIGIHEHERLLPQRILVDVKATLSPLVWADDIASTYDYDELRVGIQLMAKQKHYLLQETFAYQILTFVLSQEKISTAEVYVRKPDIYDDCESVGVVIQGEKETRLDPRH